MAKLIPVEKKPKLNFAEELEKGNILFFEKSPFPFPPEDLEFLLQQKQTGAKNRKNIAYKPGKEKITNAVGNEERLLSIMRNYSIQVTTFLKTLLPSYATCWKLDYASFRPFQEKGRELRLRARNDLLHTDAFPTRPMHGSRILRFFTNINPHEARKWMTSMPFEKLVEDYGGEKGVPFPKSPNEHWTGKLQRIIKKAAKKAGLPVVLRSPYDEFMMHFHNYLKENEEFQKNCPKDHWDFPPGSCWIVFTDQVSHAALAGQYALEQTLIIPKSGLVNPELAPISVLERLSRERMIDPIFSNH
ncbi:MAG TPA: Kdo hydroxylase family protein [Chlamydiales bacterium]|nr:Kdo hydroxylase family protein [Chlamydiales bacterium]